MTNFNSGLNGWRASNPAPWTQIELRVCILLETLPCLSCCAPIAFALLHSVLFAFSIIAVLRFFLQPIAEGNCVVLNALLIILCRNIVSWSVFVQNSSLAVDNKARVSISIELGEQIFILQVIFYQNDNFFHQFQKVAIQSS